jgi:hypothetical protein
MLDQAPGTSAAGEGTGGGGSGNGVLIGVGVVLLLGAAGGILYWVTRTPEQPKPTVVTTASTTAPTEPTIELPSIDPIPDAGPDTAEEAGADAGKKIGVGGGGCPAVCNGTITPAIKEAVAARAGTAKQCYKTALEGNEGLAGDMSVLVRVGADGSACSVSISSDTTGSARLQQCVRNKMIAGYPHPSGGCVDVRVPIHFAPKT